MKHKRSFISIALAIIVLVSLCAVVSTTSVSAAADSVSSRASVKASPSVVGKSLPAGTGPSWCTLQGAQSQEMWLFVQGSDRALWYGIWYPMTTGWSQKWTSLGGILSSSPCVVSRQAGSLDVFVRGTDGAVWTRSYNNGAWGAWASVGGQITAGTGPGASGWSGHLDVFVQGTNGATYQKTWNAASGWSTSWTNLGGKLTSSPAAASRGTGLIDVHVRGSDSADWTKSYNNGAWGAWTSLSGQIKSGTGPALGTWSTNFAPKPAGEGVFITGTDGAMYQKTWTAASGWSASWTNLGGNLKSSPAVAMQPHAIEIVARGSNDYIYLKEYWSGAWHNWMQTAFQGPL